MLRFELIRFKNWIDLSNRTLIYLVSRRCTSKDEVFSKIGTAEITCNIAFCCHFLNLQFLFFDFRWSIDLKLWKYVFLNKICYWILSSRVLKPWLNKVYVGTCILFVIFIFHLDNLTGGSKLESQPLDFEWAKQHPFLNHHYLLPTQISSYG